MQEPRSTHLMAVKIILRNIKGTVNHDLHFTKVIQQNKLVGYCDADFARDPNSRKSTTSLYMHIPRE